MCSKKFHGFVDSFCKLLLNVNNRIIAKPLMYWSPTDNALKLFKLKNNLFQCVSLWDNDVEQTMILMRYIHQCERKLAHAPNYHLAQWFSTCALYADSWIPFHADRGSVSKSKNVVWKTHFSCSYFPFFWKLARFLLLVMNDNGRWVSLVVICRYIWRV